MKNRRDVLAERLPGRPRSFVFVIHDLARRSGLSLILACLRA